MVGGTGESGNIIMAQTGRKKVRVEGKEGGKCFSFYQFQIIFCLEQGWVNMYQVEKKWSKMKNDVSQEENCSTKEEHAV